MGFFETRLACFDNIREAYNILNLLFHKIVFVDISEKYIINSSNVIYPKASGLDETILQQDQKETIKVMSGFMIAALKACESLQYLDLDLNTVTSDKELLEP